MGELLAIFALVLFSSNIIITKIASTKVNMNLGFLISVGMNIFFGSLLLSVQLLFFRQDQMEWNTMGFFLFLLGGVFSTYLGRWFFFETIDKFGPTRASAFQTSNPLFTAIIAWLFLGEILHWIDVSAIILILFGLFLVSYVPQAAAKQEAAAGREQLASKNQLKQVVSIKWLIQSGILLAFLSSLSYALGNIVRGVAIQSWQEPILGGVLGAFAGFVLHTITNKHTRHFLTEMKKANPLGVTLFAVSGCITITAQILVIASMHYIPISIANLITLSTPVLVTPLSYFLFKNQEKVTYITIVGIILVLCGITLIIL
ncbi:DMT family transporter [Niallia oryzisoli]|uniref:DMT family transporter n=1 Tax=Niallia oryzisoli TaxID=1737571 RepID=A0ABZ2C7V8_9BACI